VGQERVLPGIKTRKYKEKQRSFGKNLLTLNKE
jgi:hypothetical protein